MNSLAVFIVVNNFYQQTKFCIENLCKKTNIDLKLHILDNGSKDKRVTEYLEKLCLEKKWKLTKKEQPVKLSEAYNTIMQSIDSKFYCVFPLNVIVNKNWAERLIFEYQNCQEAGVISIKNGEEELKFLPILYSDDYVKNVWLSEDNTIEGIMFTEKEKILKVGLFDEKNKIQGFEQKDWSFRFSGNGFKNFYINQNSCIKLEYNNEILFPTKNKDSQKNFKEEIERMVKCLNFKK